MRFFTARRLALAALVPTLLLVGVVPGCSNESEGERCGDAFGANNDDCQGGLVCVAIKSEMNTYRCCNPNRTIINDSRCEDNAVGNTGTPDAGAGTGGVGGSSGSGGDGGTAAGGSSGSGGSGDSSTAGAGGDASSAAAGAAGSN